MSGGDLFAGFDVSACSGKTQQECQTPPRCSPTVTCQMSVNVCVPIVSTAYCLHHPEANTS